MLFSDIASTAVLKEVTLEERYYDIIDSVSRKVTKNIYWHVEGLDHQSELTK
jgi:hypothetical protein